MTPSLALTCDSDRPALPVLPGHPSKPWPRTSLPCWWVPGGGNRRVLSMLAARGRLTRAATMVAMCRHPAHCHPCLAGAPPLHITISVQSTSTPSPTLTTRADWLQLPRDGCRVSGAPGGLHLPHIRAHMREPHRLLVRAWSTVNIIRTRSISRRGRRGRVSPGGTPPHTLPASPLQAAGLHQRWAPLPNPK